ncbi:MAG: diguanylate cyclase [Solirubrobacterales bacterium]
MNNDTNSKKVGRMLQRRYIAALNIIAFLVIFSQIIIQYSITRQQDDSRVVNISGRQRMLSQRINKDAFGLYISADANDQKRYLDELTQSLELWQQSHKGLQQGDKDMGLPGTNSQTIKEMFENIDDEYSKIVEASSAIKKITSVTRYNKEDLLPYIRIVQENETEFLKGMDAIVFQYDAESKQKVNIIKISEIAILIVTFFTLMMEALLIFRPAQNHIEKSLEKVEIGRDNMEKLFETAPTAMLLVDERNFNIIKLNRLAKQVLDPSNQGFAKTDLRTILQLKEDEMNKLLKQLALGSDIDNLEIVINTEEQKPLIMLLSSNIIKYDDKRTILLGMSDITKLKAAEEVLKRYATIDEMTGLLNKRSGMLVLGNLFDYASDNNEEFCVCFLDIDGLKMINDLYGHEEGDYYIKTVSQQIKSNLNENDAVFRYGGDEIVILLINCNLNNANRTLKRIQNSLDKLSHHLNKPYPFKFSYGIASIKEQAVDTPEKLLNIADREMYKDKQKNRLN